MEYYSIAICVVAYVLFLLVYGKIDQRKQYNKRRMETQKQYGECPNKTYQREQYESIAHYCTYRRQSESLIDEITWNDLELETLFQYMNHTQSSAGEEYLYYLLHKPLESEVLLEERHNRIAYYEEEESIRITLREVFYNLGKTGKFSLIDYMQYLDTITHTSNVVSYLMIALVIGSICYIGVNAVVGCSIFITCVVIQMARYFKRKREIEPYFISFAYLIRLLRAGKELTKVDSTVLEGTRRAIEETIAPLKGFDRHTYLFRSNTASLSSNPLDLLFDYVKMIFHFDIIRFHQMLAKVQRERTAFYNLLELVGMVEAELAIAYYRKWLPIYCKPTFVPTRSMEQVDLYLPLVKDATFNTIKTNGNILLTGSNASGKSTFLRAVAVNSILAQTIVTCSARAVNMPLSKVYSSIAIRDNVLGADSYYMAEIKSIKRILDAARTSTIPVICFVDEVLRGTNTVERIAASTQILKMLAAHNVICFVATHDVELTWLLEEWYENYHFQESFCENDITFDYQLYEGPATSRNAIFLLQSIGYDGELVEEANRMASTFLAEGFWTMKEEKE